MRFLIFFIFFTTIIACTEKKQVALQPYPDPYLDSFRNKNIKEVIWEVIDKEDLSGYARIMMRVDSLKNKIREGNIDPNTYVFDNLNFVDTCYSYPCGYNESYTMEYFRKDDSTLLQKQRFIDERMYPDRKVVDNIVILKLDNQGRVKTLVDSLGLTKEFIYKDYKLILERSSLTSDHYSKDYSERKFEYNAGVLFKITNLSFERGDSSKMIYNFKNDLLSSIYGNGKRWIDVKYIYYK